MNQNDQITQPLPVANTDRIKTIDMIRGVALLGILIMNMPSFAFHQSTFIDLLKGPRDTLDFKALETMFVFFEGTMRGLFSMLFGAGMVLFMQNKTERIDDGASVAEIYYRRLLWLVVFGVINAYILLWFGDILFFYGFAGMLLYPFRKLKPSLLLAMSVLCLGIGMLKTQSRYQNMQEKRTEYLAAKKAEKEKKKLTDKQQADVAAWEEIEGYFKADTADRRKDVAKMRSGYVTVFKHLIPENASIETFGVYHGNWDVLTMMFLGMALLGVGFFSNQCSAGTYWMGLLLGYGLGFLISYLHFFANFVDGMNIGATVDRFRVDVNLLYDIKRILISTGHASLVILVYRSKLVPWLMRALGNVGQMAFTNYLMQSIICSIFYDGFGFGMFNRLRFYQIYYLVGSIWIFQLIFSSIWLQYFRFGPFEWLWRSLTYWKKQPMLLKQKTEPAYREEPTLIN